MLIVDGSHVTVNIVSTVSVQFHTLHYVLQCYDAWWPSHLSVFLHCTWHNITLDVSSHFFV